jgi:predicted nucleotidyltransferase
VLESVIEWLEGEDLPEERGPVIVRNVRDPLFGMSRESFEARLSVALAGRAIEARFFGSYGTAEFGPDSDVDLMIVARTNKSFIERAFDYEDLLDILPSMDILVYTPEEFLALTGDPSPGFWQSVVASMKRLELPDRA